MTMVTERSIEVVGNPVRRESLLRSLRSNQNAVILVVWGIVVAAVAVIVLISRAGLGQPFHPGTRLGGDMLGATLAQWWIVATTIGVMVVAVVSATVACASAATRGRLDAWSATLVGPWRITRGLFVAQVAFVLLAEVVALPIAGLAYGLGGVSLRQLGAGTAGSILGGVAASALAIAVSCRARRTSLPLVVSLLVIAGLFVVPYGIHVERGRPVGDPVMAVVPVVGVADAAAPLPAPATRYCAEAGCGWDEQNSADAPLTGLLSTVWPWTGSLPVWAWTAIGAGGVSVVVLAVTRLRVARRPRRR